MELVLTETTSKGATEPLKMNPNSPAKVFRVATWYRTKNLQLQKCTEEVVN